MHWMRWTAVAAGIAVAGAGTLALTPSTPAAKADRKLIERGAYLVSFGGCGDCHTPGGLYGAPDNDRRLSGSDLGWRGPWGVSYASNLTPDPETGLGSWTETQIVTALKTGMRPDGSALLPPMPWPNFGHLTDDDFRAIAAYLKSIPPVKHRKPATVPPDQAANATGPIVDIPPPPAWDAPKGSPGGGSN